MAKTWNNPGVRVAPSLSMLLPVTPLPDVPLSLTGAAYHGAKVRVSDLFARFGSKPNAAPRTWAFGSDTRNNGAQALESALWGGQSGDTQIVPAAARHANVDGAYVSVGYGIKTDPAGFSGVASSSRKLFLSFWIKQHSNLTRMYVAPISGAVTGTFQLGTDRGRGELATITKDGMSPLQAYVTFVSNGFISIEGVSAYGVSTSAINGSTITGNVSGASCVIAETGTVVAGAGKYFRAFHGNSGARHTTAILAHTSNGLIDIDYFDDAGSVILDGNISDNSGLFSPQLVDEWFQINLEMDFSGAQGRVRLWRNNTLVHDRDDYDVSYLGSTGLRPTLLGLDTNGLSGVQFEDVGLGQTWGEIISDSSLARVAIGDAATLAGCSSLEWQRVDAWAAGDVDFYVNRGALGETGYVYVFDDNGACVNQSEGVAITFATGDYAEGDTITLNAPSGESFGSVGPTLFYRSTLDSETAGQALSSTHAGTGTFVASAVTGSPIVEAVPGMPYGKGIAIGAEDADPDSSAYRSFHVDGPAATEFFERAVIYYPSANQAAALAYLTTAERWQTKLFWWLDDDGASPGELDLLTPTPSWYGPGEYWTNPTRFNSNDNGGAGGSGVVSAGGYTNAYLDDPTHWRSVPMVRQIHAKYNTSGELSDGSAIYRVSTQAGGVIENTVLPNMKFGGTDIPVIRYTRVKLPGFLYGFNRPQGANFYVGDIYLASGPGCLARVEVTDSADYSASCPSAIFDVTTWGENQIQAVVRKGLFSGQSLIGKHVHVHTADNQHVYMGVIGTTV